MIRTFLLSIAIIGSCLSALAMPADSIGPMPLAADTIGAMPMPLTEADTTFALPASDSAFLQSLPPQLPAMQKPISIYAMPLSLTGECRDWRRLWINTGVLATAYVGTLVVLECLPEDATAWNRAEIQKTPPFRRWYENVFKKGPEIDGDNAVFNYVLHPYAGAVYFMAARSNGFNFYRSLLYSACISTIGWEFGIEAFMERPSVQDIFITPLVGSVIGEGFYRIKRIIVDNGYELAGSRFLGGFVAFLVDPLNEFVGLFAGNPARKVAAEIRMQPTFAPGYKGLALSITF